MWFSKKEILPYLFKKDPNYQIKKNLSERNNHVTLSALFQSQCMKWMLECHLCITFKQIFCFISSWQTLI